MQIISTWILKKAPATFVSWSFRKIFGKKNLQVFERMLELPNWKKVSFYNPEKWIFEDDNSFTIELTPESRDFTQDWTNRFLDKKAFVIEVILKINGELVHKHLMFVSVDGARSLVPCPEITEVFGIKYYYWDSESLENKVFRIIGYIDPLYGNLETFGTFCNVKIK